MSLPMELLCLGMSMLFNFFSLITKQAYSSVVLWVSQNMEDDYTYNLAL